MSYLDSSLATFKSEMLDTQDCKVQDISRKVRKDISPSSLKSEGNKIQSEFNEDILFDLEILETGLPKRTPKRPDTRTKLRSFVNGTSSFASPIAHQPAGPLFASIRLIKSRPIPRTTRNCAKQRPVPSKSSKIGRAISRLMQIIVRTIVVLLLLPLGSAEQLDTNHGFRLQQSFRNRKRTRPHFGQWGIGARNAPLPNEQTNPVPVSKHCPEGTEVTM